MTSLQEAPKSPKSRQPLLHKALWSLLYLLPAVLFFSYYPIISLGTNSSMNFELSLPLIWLVLFDLVAFFTLLTLPKALNNSRFNDPSAKNSSASKSSAARRPSHLFKNLPGISDRRIFLLSLFPLYLTLSVLWSRNPLRGLLTAGIVWLLFFAIFTILFVLPLVLKSSENPQTLKSSNPQPLKTRLLFSLFISTTAVCIFCFIQSILDTCGLPRTETLLCAGCTYRSFGFPHPSGFAIEPQFMGNLLLAPTLTALYLLIFQKIPKSNKTANLLLTLAALLFSTTLFFTFSRGAIYAYAVALLILFVFALIRRQFRPALIIIPVATFLLSLGLQGTFAHFGPTSETFATAVTKSIHQLSLGLVDLRSLAKDAETDLTKLETPQNSPSNPVESAETSLVSPETVDLGVIDDLDHVLNNLDNDLKPDSTAADLVHDLEQGTTYFEGYVAESTDIRLSLNSTALATALQNPATLAFGVGLGGAGAAMFEAFPDKVGSPKEIVQNETFSLLLETGLVGLFLTHFTLILLFLAPLLPAWFIDGRALKALKPLKPQQPPKTAQKPAKLTQKSTAQPTSFLRRKLALLRTSPFWSHPALPLLAALLIAYLVTLSFFSGLPNALQIYLMPPLLYFIFRLPDAQKPENSCNSIKTAL